MSIKFEIKGIERLETAILSMVTKYSRPEKKVVVNPFTKKTKEVPEDGENDSDNSENSKGKSPDTKA